MELNMADEFMIVALIILFVLAWAFAISKTIYHFKLIKNSEISLLSKFIFLGIPFFFYVPDGLINDKNKHLYRKLIYNVFFLILTIVVFFILLSQLE